MINNDSDDVTWMCLAAAPGSRVTTTDMFSTDLASSTIRLNLVLSTWSRQAVWIMTAALCTESLDP